MARLSVLEYPDARLRLRALPVETFDPDLARLVDDMLETLASSGAIGLAAPQVNDRRRVLVTHPAGAPAPQVYVNPEIRSESGLCLVEESCLSVPGVVANVVRASEVRVRAQDSRGETFERDLAGMDAVCLQHEIDHLDGKLFVDRLSFLRRLYIRAGVRRAQRRAKAA